MNKEIILIDKIKTVLKDEKVDIALKHKIAKEGRSLKNGDESFQMVCLNLTGILTSYILEHKNNIFEDIHDLYSFVVGVGQRYKSLGIGIQNISSWF